MPTVQGEIKDITEELNWSENAKIRLSSRTDAGVSARMNLIDLELEQSLMKNLDESRIIRAIGDRLSPQLCVWGVFRRKSSLPIRLAASRTYLYRLDMIHGWKNDSDQNILEEICSIFSGKHDFSAFSRPDPERLPIRTVDECALWRREDGGIIGFKVTAESFLWNQVRRMASAINAVNSSNSSIDEIVDALRNPGRARDLGRAPADALLLWNIQHRDTPLSWIAPLPELSFHAPPLSSDPRSIARWRATALSEIHTLLESDWTSRFT
jgi:tRNA pseudouridine38-40 synthase